VNAPKFFLHKAANEIELLQIKPQMNKLHHEWIQVKRAHPTMRASSSISLNDLLFSPARQTPTKH